MRNQTSQVEEQLVSKDISSVETMKCLGSSRETDTCFNFSRLTETDELSATAHLGELNTLALHFGRSLLNVSPRDIPRLSAAVENDNSEEISGLIGSSSTNSNAVSQESELRSIDVFRESFFKMAVEDCKTEWVEFFLNMISEKTIPFGVGATMMKESFNNLWLDYRIHVENMIKKDVFGWDICTIEVPLETFTVGSNLGSRVGTCNTRMEWIHSSRHGTTFDHWRSLNTKGVDKVLKKSRGRKVNAIVRIFCFEEACQIGLDGIVRSLLLHKTSSSLFKTPLIKWIILFKWERIWRRRALKNLAFYLVFFLAFNVFLLWVSLELVFFEELLDSTGTSVFMTASSHLLAIMILRREYLQLKRYVGDARKIFPSRRFHGFKHYLSPRQNQIDLLLCGALLAFVRMLWSGESLIDFMDNVPAYYAVFAGAILLLWAKALFLAQIFKKTGVFILMLGRVVQECLPYFFILIGIMIGFGLTMHLALLGFMSEDAPDSYDREYYSQSSSSSSENGTDRNSSSPSYSRYIYTEESVQEKLSSSFGTPYEAIISMAYAMVGMFEPQVFFHCGSLSWFVVPLFVLYLVIQMIVMFNMLIAAMGDAFDGVRADEEESFLMARASFVDQNEASLTEKEIQSLKSKIGKYLYVLIPEDKQLEHKVPFWKGRIPAIKEDVRAIVQNSQEWTIKNMNETIMSLKDDMNCMEERLTKRLDERIAKCLEERLLLMEQRITNQIVASKSNVDG